MRFAADGPDIPGNLLDARDDGEVVFFCGAGVSMAKAAGQASTRWLNASWTASDRPGRVPPVS